MGQYQGYERYKDSGVEWLGEIPEHWEVWKFNHFAPIITCGVAATPEYGDDGIIFLSAQNIKKGSINLDVGYKYISKEKHKQLTKYRKPTKGDILLSRVGTVGEACVVDVDYEFSIFVSITHIRVSKSVCDNIFLVFYFSSLLAKSLYKATTLIGGGVGNLNVNDLREYKIPIPPLEEQDAIAQFLDHKTSQIDTLIAKKEALLEKLDEKRTALISHAVTKGLDPTVPMKDSGIEWLGDIPAHWEVKKLRYVGSCQNGVSKGGDYFGSGYPFVNYTDVYANPELPKEVNGLAQSTEEDRINYSVKVGDIFFTRTSETIEEIGITSTCLQSIKDAIFSGFLIRVRPFNNSLFPAFSKYYFRSQKHRLFFVKEMNLVTRASLSQDLLKRLPVLLPPFEEQKAIVQNLDRRTEEIDQQRSKVRKAINLLKEYRTALITNAVTGKIDVRQVLQ